MEEDVQTVKEVVFELNDMLIDVLTKLDKIIARQTAFDVAEEDPDIEEE